MGSWLSLQSSSLGRAGLILVTIAVSVATGASILVWRSPLTPLIVGTAALAALVGTVSLKKSIWALYVALFLSLLPTGLIPRDLHSIIADLALLWACVAWLLDVTSRRKRIVWTSTGTFMAGFMIWGLVTLTWAPDPSGGRRELVQYLINTVTFLLLLVNQIDSQKNLDGLMKTLALNGWVFVLAALGTILLQGYAFGTRLKILEVNENQFGMFLVIALPGVLWTAAHSSQRHGALRMLPGFIYIILTLVLISLSGSRGSAISLLATLAALWLWKPTRAWGKLGLLILIVAVVSVPLVFSTLVSRLSDEGNLGGRPVLWDAALMLIGDHPVTGVGIGNGRAVLPSYLREITSMFWPTHQEFPAHNPLLEVWIDTGLPGIFLYLGALASAMWLFVRQCLHWKRAGVNHLEAYFAVITSTFVGYMLSWIKGGGQQSHATYFLMLAFLLIPCHVDLAESDRTTSLPIRDVRR